VAALVSCLWSVFQSTRRCRGLVAPKLLRRLHLQGRLLAAAAAASCACACARFLKLAVS
jgi:hypothetical protein